VVTGKEIPVSTENQKISYKNEHKFLKEYDAVK
jgi:hypothetical protein